MLAATSCNQLLKMPALIQHFIEHKTAHKSLNFLEYLHEHYLISQKAHTDHDQDRDMALPFKVPAPTVSMFAILPNTAQQILSPTDKVLSFIKEKYPLPNNASLPAWHGTSIWQPPKFLA